MGTVWRGRHPDLEVDVAVKVLNTVGVVRERHLAQFHREVRAVAAMDHPHVVAVLDSGELTEDGAGPDETRDAGRPWLAMELATSTLAETPVSDWAQARAVALAMLDALGHAHARGVLHRDVKPANVLRVGAGGHRVVLSDFGLAAHGPDLASSGPRGGSAGYAAPEQWSGEPQGPWTDLYAVGRLVHALVCGSPDGSHPQFPVPADYQPWVARLTAPSPLRRYQRAADAAFALVRPGMVHPQGQVSPSAPPPMAMGQTLSFLMAFEGDAWGSDAPAPAATSSPESSSALAIHPPPLPASPQVPTRHRPPHLPGVGVGLFGVRAVRLVGRDEALQDLWQTLTAVAEGASAHVVVTGASGVGKTRVAQQLVWRAHEVGVAQVFTADEPIEVHDRAVTLRWLDTAPAPVGPVPPSTLWLRTETALDGLPEGSARRLPLDPLSAGAIGQLVRSLLPIGPGAAGRLEHRASGSPRYVLDSIAAWVRAGVLTSGPGGLGPVDASAPRPMPWVARWRDRVDAQLDDEERPALELVATWGPRLSSKAWRALAHHGGVDPAVPLTSSIAAGWIESHDDGWRWRVPEVRDVLLKAAQKSGRSAHLHRACALADPEDPLVGWHRMRAGEVDAWEPLRAGAMVLHLDRNRTALALALLDEGLAVLARNPDHVDDPAWWRLRVSHATALMQIDLPTARSVVDAAWVWVQTSGDDFVRGQVVGQGARMAIAALDHNAALTWADRSIVMNRALGNRRKEFISHGDRGNAQLAASRPADAVETLRAALQQFADLDEPRVLTWFLCRTSLAHRRLEEYDRAAECLDRARALNVPSYRTTVRNHSGDLARVRGRLDEAEALARAGFDEALAAHSTDAHVDAFNLALLALMRGRATESLDLALGYLPAALQVGHAQVKQLALAIVATATAARGDWEAFDPRLQDWRTALVALPFSDDDLEWLAQHAEQSCLEADQPERAAAVIEIRELLAACLS